MTRVDYDWEFERTQPTASPEEIVQNIEQLIKYWGKKINKATIEAFQNAKSHAVKGGFYSEGTDAFLILPTAEISSGKNARAWVSMVLYLKRIKLN